MRNILLLLYCTRIRRRIGYGITGLGYLLTDQVKWNPHANEARHNLNLLKPLKVKERAKIPKIEVSKKDELKMADLLKKHNIQPKHKKIAVTVKSGYATKEWRDENMALLSRMVLDEHKDTRIIIIGAPKDECNLKRHLPKSYHKKIVDLHGKTSLTELAALLKKCDILIGPDTGAMHIASAVDTATVTLFGPTNPKRWRPAGPKKKHLFVSMNLDCTNCGFLHSCPKDIECMKSITPEMVFREARKLL